MLFKRFNWLLLTLFNFFSVEGEQVSEEENSGDDEDLSILHDADNPTSSIIGKRKTAKKKNLLQPRWDTKINS